MRGREVAEIVEGAGAVGALVVAASSQAQWIATAVSQASALQRGEIDAVDNDEPHPRKGAGVLDGLLMRAAVAANEPVQLLVLRGVHRVLGRARKGLRSRLTSSGIF